MQIQKISYVIPCYNEEETIGEMHRRLVAIADRMTEYEFEWVFINDGSRDKTPQLLDALAAEDTRVKALHLAANRGHQIALSAGLDYASGDMVITIDADLQDPPELVDQFIEKIREGYDLVHARRKKRAGETGFKLITAKMFYVFIKKMSNTPIYEDVGDFRAFTREVLNAVRAFREPHRFLRGMFAYLGFCQTTLDYARDARFAGETKYPLRKMVKFALDAVVSFSTVPLKSLIWLSIGLWLFSLVYLAISLYAHFVLHMTVPGWTSVIILLTFFSSLNLFSLAIIGTYVGRIYEQGQNRPLYWLSAARNISLKEGNDNPLPSREMTLSTHTAHGTKNGTDH